MNQAWPSKGCAGEVRQNHARNHRSPAGDRPDVLFLAAPAVHGRYTFKSRAPPSPGCGWPAPSG